MKSVNKETIGKYFDPWLFFNTLISISKIIFNIYVLFLKDSNIPILTTNTSNARAEENFEEKEDTQSHSESSPSKQMSLLEPIVEEYTVEVDSNLDHFL